MCQQAFDLLQIFLKLRGCEMQSVVFERPWGLRVLLDFCQLRTWDVLLAVQPF